MDSKSQTNLSEDDFDTSFAETETSESSSSCSNTFEFDFTQISRKPQPSVDPNDLKNQTIQQNIPKQVSLV